jgi:hypothetical protein
MTECYYTFNVDVGQILNLDYINRKAAEGQGKGMVLVMSELALKQPFFNYLKPYGIRDYLMLFLRKSGNLNEETHTDYVTDEQTHHYSFNVLCKGQGTMTWFHRPDGGGQMLRHPNDPTKIVYETFKGLLLETIDQWTVGQTALVRTGIPHGVKNDGPEDRICLSIRINDYGWEQAKEIYNNFFKIILTSDSNLV